MDSGTALEKGGRNAAFFFFLLAVATVGFGGSLQPTLAVLRWSALAAALTYLWRRRGGSMEVGPYGLVVAGFVLLVVGHSFSSVYFWVSAQHALNILAAAIFLCWAYSVFRKNAEAAWRIGSALIMALAAFQVLVSLYQDFFAGDLRPHGTFDNPNFLAEFLAVATLLCLARLLYRKENRPTRILLGVLGSIFLFSAFSLCRSRGVLLSAVPAFGLLLVARYGVRRGATILAAFGIPVLAGLGFRSVSRFFSSDPYNYGRIIIWKSALRTFLEHPEGVGLGGYKYYWYATQEPVAAAFRKYGKFAATAHNEYLEVLTGLGVVGLVLFLAVLLLPLVATARHRKRLPENRREIAAAGSAVLLLSGMHAAFDFNFHEFGIVFVDATILGALLACLADVSTGGRSWSVPAWAIRWGVLVCPLLLLVTTSTFLGATAYDRGENALRENNLAKAERLFRAAARVDPFRAPYPDALSAIRYRRYASETRTSVPFSGQAAAALDESIRWEARAVSLSPRELKFLQRLSFLFAERFRAGGSPADMESAVALASRSLEIHPYSAETLWYRSDLLASTGRLEEAMADLERAVVFEPNFCRGYAKLAEMSGRKDPAISDGWKEKAAACRKQAAGLALEDHEMWLVGDPGK